MSDTATPVPSTGRLVRWRHALSTINPQPDDAAVAHAGEPGRRARDEAAGELDLVSRWLVITRAGVLPMTLTAGAIAGLLAARHHGFAAGWFALSFIGIALAHVS